MKKLGSIVLICVLSPLFFMTSCKKEVGCTDPLAINYNPDAEDDCCCVYDSDVAKKRYNATINFENLANGMAVELATTSMPYNNALNQSFKIIDLRYLISDVTFHQKNGENFTIKGHHYVDAAEPATMIYKPSVKVPEGEYTSISFTFGFAKEDNIPGEYVDLNIKNWNWDMMGHDLGYHYLQINGSYDSSGVTKGYMTHMGPAMKMDSTQMVVNNDFEARLDSSSIQVNNNFDFNIVMNVEQWYTNPYDFDFHQYNVNVMMDYDAQRLLNINGPSVFSFRK